MSILSAGTSVGHVDLQRLNSRKVLAHAGLRTVLVFGAERAYIGMRHAEKNTEEKGCYTEVYVCGALLL